MHSPARFLERGEQTRRNGLEFKAQRGEHQICAVVAPCPKVRYGHKETAETAADAMHKKTGDDYDAYQCPYPPCGAWHIGHTKKRVTWKNI